MQTGLCILCPCACTCCNRRTKGFLQIPLVIILPLSYCPQHLSSTPLSLCSLGQLFIPHLPEPLTTTTTRPVSPRLTAPTASVSTATIAPVTPTNPPPTQRHSPQSLDSVGDLPESHELTRAPFNAHTQRWMSQLNKAAFSFFFLRSHTVDFSPSSTPIFSLILPTRPHSWPHNLPNPSLPYSHLPFHVKTIPFWFNFYLNYSWNMQAEIKREIIRH